MTATDQLLLRLLRGGARADTLDPGLVGDVSWPEFLERCEAHGVAPLVARSLETLGWPGVSPAAREALTRARRTNAARTLLAIQALRRVLEALSCAHVPVIPLKGVALGESLYGDPALRVSSDIDVLVPRAAVPRAWAAITALGYVRVEEEPDVAPDDLDLLIESNHEYGFVSPDAPARALELHWDIAWRWPRDAGAIADLWAEARPRDFWGVPGWTLGPVWQLLYLAVHAARHRWHALKWLVDVHEICRRGGLDWGEIRARAIRFGLDEALYITLGASAALLDTPVPPDVCARRLPSWLELFPATPRPLGVWRGALYPARLFARPADKAAYVARVLLRPTLGERRWIRLPARLGALYYPLRPLRLAGRWAKALTSLRDRADHRGSARPPGRRKAGPSPSHQESA